MHYFKLQKFEFKKLIDEMTINLRSIVIDSVPFWSKRLKFFVPVCKLVPEYPTFHLESNFGPFRSIPVIPTNSGRDVNFGRYWIWPIKIFFKKKVIFGSSFDDESDLSLMDDDDEEE